jgi:hypothetical protein
MDWQERLNDPGHTEFVAKLAELLALEWDKASDLAELIDDRVREILLDQKLQER